MAIDLEKWAGRSAKVLIQNQLGVPVFVKTLDVVQPLETLDLTKFENGQYFVTLETPGLRRVTKKLAVARMY